MIRRLPQILIGTAFSLTLVMATAFLSSWPPWQSLPEDYALIRLSFTQGGVRNCRDRTDEELAALPQNMRQDQICDRRRAPVYVELDLNGETSFAQTLPPSGLSGSGPSRVYRRFELPAGSYDISVRLRDDPTRQEFTSTASQRVILVPAQSLAIDYDDESGGFIFD